MLTSVKIGTVLLQDGVVAPHSVWMTKETFCSGWQAIANMNGDDLDRQIRAENWNFIFVAGSLRGSSWGSWTNVAVRCAAIRVLRRAKLAKFNGFEITGIQKRTFLGFHYVTVIGHSRHLQQSVVLHKLAQRSHQATHPASSVDSNLPAVPLPAPEAAK
jgi:hypothetical protein